MRIIHAHLPGLQVITRTDVLTPATSEDDGEGPGDHRGSADGTTTRKKSFVLADIRL